jgi:hypothetical protein
VCDAAVWDRFISLRVETIAMDPATFDRLTRMVSDGASRRGVIAGAVALLLTPLVPGAAGQAKRGRGGRRRRGKTRRPGTAPSQAGCFGGSPCQVGPRANLARCDLSGLDALRGANCAHCNLEGANLAGADARGAILRSANLGGACLTDADLAGAKLASANLRGAVLCRTTMPNGTVDNSGCDTPTSCCQTCNVPIGGDCDATGALCCGDAVCQGEVCRCPAGRIDCGGACVDPETDRRNCGGCGRVCAEGQACVDGACSGCPAGQEELANGSCAEICDPGIQDCPSGCFCSMETPGPINFYCTDGILSQLCFDSSECPPGAGCFSFRCAPLCDAD